MLVKGLILYGIYCLCLLAVLVIALYADADLCHMTGEAELIMADP